eukprot:TRINITY_DN12157_c0_g1_i1.p4 TRINITY_DN12157_c0_g1~~TRINITY_DN12157_c0_g1_i1.p4  ORF type:complete len:101 (-),score=16.26 TRINITY_DN12157_c0_g1_i1:3-305(-)
MVGPPDAAAPRAPAARYAALSGDFRRCAANTRAAPPMPTRSTPMMAHLAHPPSVPTAGAPASPGPPPHRRGRDAAALPPPSRPPPPRRSARPETAKAHRG